MNQDKKILIVEDELTLQNVIKIKLETSGYGTCLARDVKSAIQCLEAGDIKAVWLDHYLLGSETGIDLVAKMKSKEGGEWSKIPIFVVSNTATEEKVLNYINLGVDKYFVKANERLSDIIEELKKVASQ